MKRHYVLLVLAVSFFLFFVNLSSADTGKMILREDSFSNVAKEVGPAVVSVTVIQVYTYGGRHYYYPFREWDPYLDEFLRDFFEAPREYRQSGLGSGVIIDKRGYILTNDHVVDGADQIQVTLSDGRKFKAVIKGSDPRSDLAVIKIKADNLPVAKLGNSDKVEVGQWVMAIGNPFGFIMSNSNPTVTVGVVSALHRSFSYRSLNKHRYYGDLIQTDAAINRGNSGGPLVNLKAKIIGINALIYSTSGGSQGIGFAIPINRARRILDELIAGKKIKYGWLGVQVQSVSPELMALFNFPDSNGALIAKVIHGSPADKGGLKKGDLIRKIGDYIVKTANDLVDIISHLDVGKKIKIFIVRDGKPVICKVTISERPKKKQLISEQIPLNEKQGWRGISVKDSDGGVVVSKVLQDSPAFIAGIRQGDTIDEINRSDIRSLRDFNRITISIEGEALVHTNKGYFVVRKK